MMFMNIDAKKRRETLSVTKVEKRMNAFGSIPKDNVCFKFQAILTSIRVATSKLESANKCFTAFKRSALKVKASR